ncbi:MAG: hypothetical protein EOO87_00890 [Pedobacter sp.]|nr:MAG: hypothetical protein EOO87_00890 [Pedobacter sp.]
MPKQYAVVTIAVGKSYYLNLAKNLIRSFLKWNSSNNIYFLLVTDDRNYFSEFFNNEKIEIKKIHVNDDDRSFTSKFLLFDHVDAEENLFIDCDCIIYGDLTQTFEHFKLQDFSAIGTNIVQGSFFCDVEHIIAKLNLSYIPKFVGSVYYFKNNETAKAIFELAKKLKSKYDELGFIRLRGKENEEPLFASAMASFNQQLISDDGLIKADAMFFDQFNCNVLTGKAELRSKNLAGNGHSTPKISYPVIVHYNDRYTEMPDYLAEQFRLETHLPNFAINVIVKIRYMLPSFLTTTFKNAFRSFYHQLLGPSKIKDIKRMD